MFKDILVSVLIGIVMAIIGGNAVTAYICGLLTLIALYVITLRLEQLKIKEFIEDIKRNNEEYIASMQTVNYEDLPDAVESVEGEVVNEYGAGTAD